MTKTVIQAVTGRVNKFGIIIAIRIRIKNKPVYGFFWLCSKQELNGITLSIFYSFDGFTFLKSVDY